MSLFESFNLGNGFRKYFRIEQAHDPAKLEAVLRIRQEVFRENLGKDIPHQDSFDAASLHCLIRKAAAPGEAIGCARLILGERLPQGTQFPFEVAASGLLGDEQLAFSGSERKRIGEISMLAVRRTHRRRAGEATIPISIQSEDFTARDQPRFPFLPIGLYLGTLALAADRGLETLYMLASPRLVTHLGRLGIPLQQAGTGATADQALVPVMIDVASSVSAMPFLLQPIWESVRQDLRRTPLAP